MKYKVLDIPFCSTSILSVKTILSSFSLLRKDFLKFFQMNCFSWFLNCSSFLVIPIWDWVIIPWVLIVLPITCTSIWCMLTRCSKIAMVKVNSLLRTMIRSCSSSPVWNTWPRMKLTCTVVESGLEKSKTGLSKHWSYHQILDKIVGKSVWKMLKKLWLILRELSWTIWLTRTFHITCWSVMMEWLSISYQGNSIYS